MKDTAINASIGTALAAGAFWFLTMWLAPQPIAAFTRWASVVDVKPGQEITIYSHNERRGGCDSIIWRSLISADGKVVLFEPFQTPVRPGGTDDQEFTFNAPSSFSDGPMIYRVHSEFRCNAIQRWLGGQMFVLPDIIFNYRTT